MLRSFLIALFCLAAAAPAAFPQAAGWLPPSVLTREEIVQASNTVLASQNGPVRVAEDIRRIRAVGMDWDIAAAVYEPEDPAQIAVGPDGKRIGLFLLHGGSGDHRSQASIARLLAGRFGFKVVTMSYPGRLYLLDPSRDWPGDTIHPDGSVRTPIWNKDRPITPDQYDVVEDRDENRRKRWGTLILACAHQGTEFYDRMAGWPVAFEEGAREMMRRHLPAHEFSIYVHGHSTGGPFVYMLSQRVANIAGILAMESTPFGYMMAETLGDAVWDIPFECLRIRTWRDTARYAGPEALAEKGPEALLELPLLMETVFERWAGGTKSPQFKAENMIHFNGVEPLRQAALATARRLQLSERETADLVDKYVGYTRELSGSGVKGVPPVLIGIAKTSRDQTVEINERHYLPMFARMHPRPKVNLVRFEAGVHSYTRPEPDLPFGLFPAVAQLWNDAIRGGYFHQ